MINYEKELNKIDDIVEKFDEIVARELSKSVDGLGGTLNDIVGGYLAEVLNDVVDDYLDEVLDDIIEVNLTEDEEIIFDTYEVKQAVLDEIRNRLNFRVWAG